MDILTIKNLKKSFGDKVVLDGLDLCVPKNCVFGFVGRNGAGKTTTMKAILGLLKIDEGEIYVCGEKVRYGQTSTNQNIGYLPDVPEFYPFMTPKEYLRLCGQSLNMSQNDIDERSSELLELVGLSQDNRRIKGFSRGMKQRLGIASALLARPKLLICDEPTSALDPIGRKEILDILLSVREQTTVLFSTHILSDVERICTDVAFLNDGKIELKGTVDELKNIHLSEEFTVELINAADADKLLNTFDNVRLTQNDVISFVGGEDRMFEILDFVKENKISLRKIERCEQTLESLFMEVVKK